MHLSGPHITGFYLPSCGWCLGRAALGGQKNWQDAAPATGAIMLQLPALGRTGEVSRFSAGGASVSGTVPNRNHFVFFLE